MREWKMQEWKNWSENVWKTVRTENKNSHQWKITDTTHPISKERLELGLSNLVHMEAIPSLTKRIKKSPQKGRGYGHVTHLNFYFP